jgi:predicted acyl esterase
MTTDQNASPRTAGARPPGRTPAPGRGTGRLPVHVRVMRRLSGRGLPGPVCDVGLERGIAVPAADGVPLITDHYVPLAGGPWPTLLVRSPYGRGFPWDTLLGAMFAQVGIHDLHGFLYQGGAFKLADALTGTTAALAAGRGFARFLAAALRAQRRTGRAWTRLPLIDAYTAGHFDVFARLCAVDPRGRSWNVCDGMVRVDADGWADMTVPMSSAAYEFGAGHRLRLQVAGGAHPRFARNTGTGEPLATATALVPGTTEVAHGPDSVLTLPVIPPGAGT